jgi:hypothetical protein
LEPTTTTDGNPDLNEMDPPLKIPRFYGTAFWSGKSDEVDTTCFTAPRIAKDILLDSKKSYEVRKSELDKNADQICDFENKFQVCVNPKDDQETTTVNVEGGGGEPVMGICRCLENTYINLDGVCYIPAGRGSPSTCGKLRKLYLPIPDSNDELPQTMPKCVPNAECISSPYHFGLRCSCKSSSRFFRGNYTCSSAFTLVVDRSGIAISFLILGYSYAMLHNNAQGLIL